MHPAKKSQIILLLAKKVIVLEEYFGFDNVFSKKLTTKLLERFNINKYEIDLEPSKQPLYKPTYSLELVELKTLKTYVENNLANEFIQASKSSAWALILFVKRSDGSFCLSVGYWGSNNLTIKNWYPLSLIGESLNRLRQAKQFT